MPQEPVPAHDEPAEHARHRRAVEDEAEEGLLLAEYATRMKMKNRIIVDTLTLGGGVDVDAWVDELRLALGRLRMEAETSARRVAAEREVAAVSGGTARHEHDYRQSDAHNLDRRRKVYRLVARRLLSWENNDEQVHALLDAARRDAAEEMDAALDQVLEHGGEARVEDEAVLRERLRLIVDVDLAALERGASPEPPQAVGTVETDGPLRRLGGRLLGRRRAGERGRGPR